MHNTFVNTNFLKSIKRRGMYRHLGRKKVIVAVSAMIGRQRKREEAGLWKMFQRFDRTEKEKRK
ncbi:hypothetical protein DI291_0460 [Bacillus paralicheniformis]|nr:hypothetical protein DI291_0460 [Bacillus paralicheniformis]